MVTAVYNGYKIFGSIFHPANSSQLSVSTTLSLEINPQ